MKRIGIISDTHGYWDDKYRFYFDTCDEIWHAGDIGTLEVAQRLAEIKPLRAVCGNVDGGDLRRMFPERLRFKCENVDVLMTHIGGYPKKYAPNIKAELLQHPPKLFISGHSHILKVMFDQDLGLLHLNPGACGNVGWHKVRTMMRFVIDRQEIKDLEVIELGTR